MAKLWTSIAMFALVLASGCDRPGSLGSGAVASGVRTTTLAYQADPTFGRALRRGEWRKLATAESQALDFARGGVPVRWEAERGRVNGTVTVSPPFTVSGSECRRFEHKLIAPAAPGVAGVACKEDGSNWRLVS